MVRFLIENIALVADISHQAHDQFLADRVNRRIGNLCEQLLEIVEQQLRFFRKHRQRGVIAHRTGRFVSGHSHRLDDHIDIFAGIAEKHLLPGDIFADNRGNDRVKQSVQRNLVLLNPAAVWLASGNQILDFRIKHHPLSAQVNVDHLAGAETALLHHVLSRNIQYAGFRCKYDKVVFSNSIAGRAQTVAVKHCAYGFAVGERERGRAVPRFHQAGMVFEEAAKVVPEVVIFAPCLRNQHHHRVRQASTGVHKYFQGVIEAGGIALPLLNYRQQFFNISAEKVGFKRIFPGFHLVDVAAQGVDLAIVRQKAERLRQRPGRESVGTVTLMHNRQRTFKVFAGQVRKEFRHLRGHQQTFVDDNPAGKADYIKTVTRAGFHLNRLFNHSADNIKFAFKRDIISVFFTGGNKELLDLRTAVAGNPAKGFFIDRNVSPAEKEAVFFRDCIADYIHAVFAHGLILRQKNHANRIFTGRRQLKIQTGSTEKFIRDLQQNACTVTGIRIAACGTAMQQPFQDFYSMLYNFMRFFSINIGDKTHPASVVFVFEIIQPALVRMITALLARLVHFSCLLRYVNLI